MRLVYDIDDGGLTSPSAFNPWDARGNDAKSTPLDNAKSVRMDNAKSVRMDDAKSIRCRDNAKSIPCREKEKKTEMRYLPLYKGWERTSRDELCVFICSVLVCARANLQ